MLVILIMTEDFIPGEPIYYAHVLSRKFKQLLIVVLSDIHRGNPLSSEKHFNRTIKTVVDTPNLFVVLNGDLCESSLRTSKGEIYKQVGSPKEQRDWMIDKLKPIKHKILGCTRGNHEDRIYKETSIDICEDIAKALEIPYRAEGILLKISFGNYRSYRPYTYWGYVTHGYGGARTKAAKAVKVERVATWIHADFYAMSHDHVVNVAPDVYLMPDPRTRESEDGFLVGTVTAHRKMLIKTNAFLKWGGYAEAMGFPPVDLETPIIKLIGEGKKPQVKVEV